ncbi:hypothetical protein Aab01nite_02460 [Paractinoplanes abujensis]|uniref:Enterochelin esterase family protein n=1 Tax=Paractinoplanes abujensis TaxID=882441 RepID=A0A7W7CRE8_9ACTN|nr:alpha/beta hydrolase-fold protein [Actinoplanes abujensis]MBB4691925.1 enterochelin esterase family protein [Actinoplanes abujensis]GID16656.1 hypothetical protein Aab01nite_02460 [Actinoplanes abujensis]
MRSPRLAGLLEATGRPDADRLWAELTAAGTPLVEPWDDGHSLVTFLWRGAAERVRTWWNIDVALTRIPGTDIWHGSEVFPDTLRTLYALVQGDTQELPRTPGDTGPAQLDRDNPLAVHFEADPADPTDSSCWASELRLPASPRSPWTTPRPQVPAGRLSSDEFRAGRPVTTYLPYGVEADGLPVLVMFDGYNAQTVLRVPTILDNLIAEGRVPPMAALLVRGRDEHRLRDLTPGPALDELIDELMPWAETTWGIGSPYGDNLVAGQSRGGLVATHLGLRRPDLFRGVIAQSASFWWPAPADGEPGRLIRDAERLAHPDVRYFLDVGRLESAPTAGEAPSQLEVVRRMRDTLRARHCHVTYAEYDGGHDYVNWRHNLPEALIALSQ